MQFQITQDGAVDMGGAGVVLPHRQVGLDIHAAHAVKGYDVKIRTDLLYSAGCLPPR